MRVTWPPPATPCLAHLLANGLRTNTIHVASTQGCCHCDVAAAPCYTRVHSRRYAAAPSHHLPLSLLAQARVAPTQCAAIKEDPSRSFVCPCPHHCLPLVSHPDRASPLFSATSSVTSHLTPPLSSYAGPRASSKPRAAPQPEGPAPSPPLSSGAVDRADQLRLSVVRHPHFDSAPGTISSRCAEVHGCFPWTSSRGPSSRRSSLAAPRHAPAPCGPRRGMSMAFASGQAVQGGDPSLGSTSVHSLAVG
jgi:hypothetical protein